MHFTDMLGLDIERLLGLFSCRCNNKHESLVKTSRIKKNGKIRGNINNIREWSFRLIKGCKGWKIQRDPRDNKIK